MKKKGVILSSELMLILAAVVVLALIALLSLGRMVMNQSSSQKATVTLTDAHVRVYYQGSKCIDTSVTVYLTNLAGQQIQVSRIWLTQPNGNDFTNFPSLNAIVNPGETYPISTDAYGSCPTLTASSGSVFLYVQYTIVGSSRTVTVGEPVQVETYNG